jgi:hypothetical protein
VQAVRNGFAIELHYHSVGALDEPAAETAEIYRMRLGVGGDRWVTDSVKIDVDVGDRAPELAILCWTESAAVKAVPY